MPNSRPVRRCLQLVVQSRTARAAMAIVAVGSAVAIIDRGIEKLDAVCGKTPYIDCGRQVTDVVRSFAVTPKCTTKLPPSIQHRHSGIAKRVIEQDTAHHWLALNGPRHEQLLAQCRAAKIKPGTAKAETTACYELLESTDLLRRIAHDEFYEALVHAAAQELECDFPPREIL